MLDHQPLLTETAAIYEEFRHKVTFKGFQTILSAALVQEGTKDMDNLAETIKNYLRIATDPKQELAKAEEMLFGRISTTILTSGKIIVAIPNLSIAAFRLERLLEGTGHKVKRLAPDSTSIAESQNKEVTLTLASRNEELKQLATLLESSQEKAKNAKMVILVLGHLAQPLHLQINWTTLRIANPHALLTEDTVNAVFSHQLPPQEIL
jgi:hypothetical protein